MDEALSVEKKFYEGLKNAQPIIFLSSFAMVIAVFSYSNKDIAGIYNNAVLASIMFLVSFILSITDQLTPKKDNDEIIIRGGKFFFLAIGVLYLIVIAYEFSKPLPQVFLTVYSWGLIAVGIGFYTPIYQRRGKFTSKLYESQSYFKGIIIVGTLAAFSLISVGLIGIWNVFTGNKIPKETLELVQIILFISGITLFVIEFCLIIFNEKRKQKKI